MVDESAMRIVVALVYRGASVVGKSHLRVSFVINTNTNSDADTDTIRLAAVRAWTYVERIPPLLVAIKPMEIPVARL
jgi:hypothetical protein